MSCSVAVSNSSVFSLSSSSHYYTKSSIISSSSEPLTLALPILNSPSTTSSCSSHSSPVLKRKRPTKLHIPVVSSLTIDVLPVVPSPSSAKNVVEVEGCGFSVYCKRGSRKHMEDRYSASVDLHGEPNQVIFLNKIK